MPKAMSVTEILIKARAKIRDPQNWIKGALHKGNRHCALGAIEAAEGSLRVLSPTREAALYLEKAMTGKNVNGGGAIGFNDDYRTTHAQVIDKFCQAIQMAAKAEGIEVEEDLK